MPALHITYLMECSVMETKYDACTSLPTDKITCRSKSRNEIISLPDVIYHEIEQSNLKEKCSCKFTRKLQKLRAVLYRDLGPPNTVPSLVFISIREYVFTRNYNGEAIIYAK